MTIYKNKIVRFDIENGQVVGVEDFLSDYKDSSQIWRRPVDLFLTKMALFLSQMMKKERFLNQWQGCEAVALVWREECVTEINWFKKE